MLAKSGGLRQMREQCSHFEMKRYTVEENVWKKGREEYVFCLWLLHKCQAHLLGSFNDESQPSFVVVGNFSIENGIF